MLKRLEVWWCWYRALRVGLGWDLGYKTWNHQNEEEEKDMKKDTSYTWGNMLGM